MLKFLRHSLLLSAVFAAGSAQAQTPDKLDVVASFSIIADFAKNVGGDRIALTTLVGPDGDAHVYEPRPADAVAMGAAEVILVNGLEFEGFLERLVETSASKAPVVELTKGGEILKPAEGGHDHGAEPAEAAHEGETGHDHAAEEATDAGHDHGEFDPHAWQSVHNAETYVNNIKDAFCAADAAGCDIYTANAETYLAKLETLDEEIKASVAALPPERRTVITSHDAFGYFEHEYGIRFLAPEGVSTESEASAADVAALIRQIREDKAWAIFVETISDPRLAEQIANETGLKIGGELYSDALSDESGPAPTYIDMMKHNVSTITAAIAGS